MATNDNGMNTTELQRARRQSLTDEQRERERQRARNNRQRASEEDRERE